MVASARVARAAAAAAYALASAVCGARREGCDANRQQGLGPQQPPVPSSVRVSEPRMCPMAVDDVAERQPEVIQQREFHGTGSFARPAPSSSGEPVSCCSWACRYKQSGCPIRGGAIGGQYALWQGEAPRSMRWPTVNHCYPSRRRVRCGYGPPVAHAPALTAEWKNARSAEAVSCGFAVEALGFGPFGLSPSQTPEAQRLTRLTPAHSPPANGSASSSPAAAASAFAEPVVTV